jgi:hypothetical protein
MYTSKHFALNTLNLVVSMKDSDADAKCVRLLSIQKTSMRSSCSTMLALRAVRTGERMVRSYAELLTGGAKNVNTHQIWIKHNNILDMVPIVVQAIAISFRPRLL